MRTLLDTYGELWGEELPRNLDQVGAFFSNLGIARAEVLEAAGATAGTLMRDMPQPCDEELQAGLLASAFMNGLALGLQWQRERQERQR